MCRNEESRKILVAYCGRYTTRIGPPKSMYALASLLEGAFSVTTTANLRVGSTSAAKNERNGSTRTGAASDAGEAALLMKVKPFLSLLSLAYHIARFNWEIFWFTLRSPGSVVIISQPFVLYSALRRQARLIFIRRANRDLDVLLGDSRLKCFFERKFIDHCEFDLVFLVPNESRRFSHVIPNHFRIIDFPLNEPSLSSSLPNVHWVGTWDCRKGADRLMLAFKKFPPAYRTNIFGGLGSNSALNSWVKSAEPVKYWGVVDRPYNRFLAGDIFITLSYLEGFQRAMVEAMLKGCLLVAVVRPDTLPLKEFPGVFMLEWHDDEPDASAEEFSRVMAALVSMGVDERVRLGLQNRERISGVVSETAVLGKWIKLIGI